MPGFFDSLKSFFSLPPYASSTVQRKIGRSNLVTSVLGSTFQTLIPQAVIPTKFIQTLLSFYVLFRPDAKFAEKSTQLLMVLLAAAELGISVEMLFSEELCTDNASDLCKAALLFNILYNSTLAFSTIPAEFYKELSQNQTVNTATTHLLDSRNELNIPQHALNTKAEESDTEHSATEMHSV